MKVRSSVVEGDGAINDSCGPSDAHSDISEGSSIEGGSDHEESVDAMGGRELRCKPAKQLELELGAEAPEPPLRVAKKFRGCGWHAGTATKLPVGAGRAFKVVYDDGSEHEYSDEDQLSTMRAHHNEQFPTSLL